MNVFSAECLQVLDRVLGGPQSTQEGLILRAVAAGVLYISFRAVLAWSDARRVDLVRTLLSLVAGVSVLLAASTVTARYLLPMFHREPLVSVMALLAPVAVGLIVGVPVQCQLLKARYVPMMMAFGLSVAVTLLALLATGGVIESLDAGSSDSARLIDRQRGTETFLQAR